MKKKIIKSALVMAMVAICVMMAPAQRAEASSQTILMYSSVADYSEWELNGPIANKGWYIDPDLGGERYNLDMRDAWYQVNGYPMHPVLGRTSEPYPASEIGVYHYADKLIGELAASSKMKKGGISEDKAFELIQGGYLATNRKTLIPSTYDERNRAIKMILGNGFLSEYVQQFKDMGYLEATYELPAGYVNRSATTNSGSWYMFAGATPNYTGSLQ